MLQGVSVLDLMLQYYHQLYQVMIHMFHRRVFFLLPKYSERCSFIFRRIGRLYLRVSSLRVDIVSTMGTSPSRQH